MRIRRRHSMDIEHVRQRVDELAADLGKRFSLHTEWHGNDLRVKGSSVHGHIAVTESLVEVDVQLGFGLGLMEGPIRRAIENAMDEHLA